MTDEHPDPGRWWKHRRRMAYVSLAAIIISLTCALAGVIREPMIPLVEGLCWVLGVIVIGYFGNNAIEAFSQKK